MPCCASWRAHNKHGCLINEQLLSIRRIEFDSAKGIPQHVDINVRKYTIIMTQATVEFRRAATPHPETQRYSVEQVEALFALPFMELVFRAAEVHRQHFDPTRIQL